MPDVKIFRWLFVLPLLAPACAFAQVQVNKAALQQLQGLAIAPEAPPVSPAATRPPAHHQKPKEPVSPTVQPPALAAQQGAPAMQSPQIVAAPSQPTPNVTLHTPILPPTIKIAFTSNSAALPTDANAMLKPFCTSPSRIHILARAPGSLVAPNGAMELSMQRAFAIRAALISCGVAAQNIIPQSIVVTSGLDSDEALVGANIKP